MADGDRLQCALYHPWVYLTSGIERSFVEILARSRHDWTIYTHHFAPDSTYPELRDGPIVELEPRVSVRRSFGPLLGAAWTLWRAQVPPRHADALLISSEGLGDLVLRRAAAPAVAYCHTPLKILYDPVNRAALAERSPPHALALRVLGPAFDLVDRAMWRRYVHVFANSAETQDRIVSAGLAVASDVEVLHPGVDTERFEPARDRDDFLLVAGRIMWQKNVELAIDTVRLLGERDGRRVRLVVAGAVDAKSEDYFAELRRRAADLSVTFERDPSDARLQELYARCLVLLFTPRNEDFGMVPLEAMASGAPVVAVDAGGVRETVVHDRTGWLLPNDPDAWARQLREVLDGTIDLAPVRGAARRRAERFGWEQFVSRLDDVMETAATTTGRPR